MENRDRKDQLWVITTSLRDRWVRYPIPTLGQNQEGVMRIAELNSREELDEIR